MRSKAFLLPALAAALFVSGCGGTVTDGPRYHLGGTPSDRDRERFRRADPSRVIATELAFARAAQEDGQWNAFIHYSTEDAVMFVPQTVNAHEWLKQQPNPAQAVRWQPHQVWSSCDGTLAVTRGAWQRPDGSFGYFTTVWKRQRNGEYKWVMDQGDTLAAPLDAPEMIEAKVADCGPPNPVVMSGRDFNVTTEGRSEDQTLYWNVTVRPDGGRSLLVLLSQGGTMAHVLNEIVAPGG